MRDASGAVIRTYEDEAFRASAPGQYVLAAVEAPLYGSARLGSERTRIRVRFTGAGGSLNPPPGRRRGGTVYELSNRLGNVLATVSDIAAVEPVANAEAGTGEAAARVTTASDYYPFGLSVAGRTYEPVLGGSAYADVVAEYRYGFNGKEHDMSWGGLGIQDYGFRLYVPGIGRFLSVDPLTRSYPYYTPYQFAGNRPIQAIDLDGLEEHKVTGIDGEEGTIHGPYQDPQSQADNGEVTVAYIKSDVVYTESRDGSSRSVTAASRNEAPSFALGGLHGTYENGRCQLAKKL